MDMHNENRHSSRAQLKAIGLEKIRVSKEIGEGRKVLVLACCEFGANTNCRGKSHESRKDPKSGLAGLKICDGFGNHP